MDLALSHEQQDVRDWVRAFVAQGNKIEPGRTDVLKSGRISGSPPQGSTGCS